MRSVVIVDIHDAALQSAAKAFNPVIRVTLDVKSDGAASAINPKSKGVIPAAILGTSKFDVSTIDASRLRFGPNAATVATKPVITDVDGDGIPDLLLHFGTQDAGIKCTDTAVVVTGKTGDGTMIPELPPFGLSAVINLEMWGAV